MANEIATQQEPRPLEQVKRALQAVPFEDSLPSNINPDKFRNVVMTAINLNPDLLGADRSSLLTACMKLASDGLMPDNREATLNIYSTKVKRNGEEVWIKLVQALPMVGDVIKRLRNSGEIASITAHVVYEKDHFEYILGDDEKITHRPSMDKDPGPVVGAYAIAKFTNGMDPQREFMPRRDIDKVRAASKSGDTGPWAKWFEEMARKSAVKRLSKYLPMSAESAAFLQRDDDDMSEPTDAHFSEVVTLPVPAAKARVSKLDHFEAEVTQVVDKPRRTKAKEPTPASEPDLDKILAEQNAQTTRSALSEHWQSDAFQGSLKSCDLEQQSALKKNYSAKYASLPEEEIDDVL